MSDADYAATQQVTRDAFAQVLAMPDAPVAAASRLPQLRLDSRDVHTLGYALERVGRVSQLPVLDAATAADATVTDDTVKVDRTEAAAVADLAVRGQKLQDAAAQAVKADQTSQQAEVVKPDRGQRRVAFAPIPDVAPPSTPKPAAVVPQNNRLTARRITAAVVAEAFKFRDLTQTQSLLDDLLKAN